MAATTKCSVTDHIPEGPLLSKTTSTLNCDTCSRQFDSSINYRRHMLTHDRTSNKDKELAGDRGLLQNYWDRIDKDDFTNVVSLMIKEEFRDAMLGCLELFILKPRIIPPRAYVKAGNSLLDVVRSKWTKDRIGSEELFKILDDASEQTFLCSVIDDSVRTHVFEGDNDISPGNLGAHICFLFEEALVKHWNRHRIAQSLVDEEENEKQRQEEMKKRQQERQGRRQKHAREWEREESEREREREWKQELEQEQEREQQPQWQLSRKRQQKPQQIFQSSEAAVLFDAEKDNNGGPKKTKFLQRATRKIRRLCRKRKRSRKYKQGRPIRKRNTRIKGRCRMPANKPMRKRIKRGTVEMHQTHCGQLKHRELMHPLQLRDCQPR